MSDEPYLLPHHIGLNFAANYQSYKRRSTEERISWQNGHTWYLDVSASCQVHKNINLLSEYFLRYDKVPRLQGEEYAQDEEWMLGANASMLKQKLTILLAFTIPTNAIPKRTYSKTMLPEYEYTTWSNEKVNNAIALLSIRYNIGKGKTSKSQNLNKSEAEKSF